MNKPLKMLLAVGVLAFTAAGMYYALLAPSKSNASAPSKASRPQPVPAERVITPGAKVGGELPGSLPAGAAPSPALNAPATPAATSASAPASSGSAVPGFSPASEPMKPLPTALPGFEPATTSTTSTTASAAPATPSPSAQPAPATAAPAMPASSAPAPTKPATVAPMPTTSGPAGAASGSSAATAAPVVAPVKATPPAPRVDTYTVKEGDSLVSIWRGLTGQERGWEALQAANPGLDASRLKIGQVLKVPDWKSRETPAPKPAAAPSSSPGAYTVQSGDTLSSIAAKVYGDSKLWKRIYDANRDAIGSDPGALKVGQSLRVPPKSDGAAAPTPASNPAPAGTPAPR